jgi:hypothetical protein
MPDLQISARVGSQDIVASGTIVAFAEDVINVTIDDGAGKLFLDIHFKENKDDSKTDLRGEVISDNHLRLTFQNFNNSLGAASSGKLQIAVIGGKQHYLTHAVYSIGTSKVMHYTVYRDG